MSHVQLTEKDLDKLFSKSFSKKPVFLRAINYILAFIAIFFIVYGVINISAIITILSYWYSSEIKLDSPGSTTPFKNAVVAIKNDSNQVVTKDKIPNISDDHIFIPAINVDAPISWQINNNEGDVQNALQKGVIQLKGTAVPGENGNVFITGHSSNYFWAKGDYKNVFALLNRLFVGDLIYVKYKSTVYVYKTSSLNVVKPTDLSAIQPSATPTLTLMTCSPVGTSINRLIVKADQIVPDNWPSGTGAQSTPSGLPGGVR